MQSARVGYTSLVDCALRRLESRLILGQHVTITMVMLVFGLISVLDSVQVVWQLGWWFCSAASRAAGTASTVNNARESDMSVAGYHCHWLS